MAKKLKKITKFFSQMGIGWQTVYLITTGMDKKYMKTFFHDGEKGNDHLTLTDNVKEALFFESFDKAYWWTHLISTSTEPINTFVMKAKVKGSGKHRKMMLSKEMYYS